MSFKILKKLKKQILFLSLLLFFSSQSISINPENASNLNFIADVVENVGSAVVNIDVVKMERAKVFNPFADFNNEFGFEMDPRFRSFFEDKIVPRKGAGSGFIINKEGFILTNSHVVKGSDKIKVTLKDGRSFEAKSIGQDQTLDLAVIKIDSHDLPTVKLGNSQNIRPGEWVIAIGNPYGFSNTVTAGIISGIGRNLEDLGKRDLIQTDAPINPGNSGGPLLNAKGEVIGVNVAIVAQAQGIGFAIPINEAKDVLEDLIKKGKVVRPWLGIQMRDMDQKIANYLDIPFSEGIVVTDVLKSSPAEKIGFKKYDVVKQLNNKKIASTPELQKTVASMKPGEQVLFLIYREGKNYTLKGNLGERPESIE